MAGEGGGGGGRRGGGRRGGGRLGNRTGERTEGERGYEKKEGRKSLLQVVGGFRRPDTV